MVSGEGVQLGSATKHEDNQLRLRFDGLLALMPVDEIYEKVDQKLLERLKEDRRIERKPEGIQARQLGDYFSMWANTIPEGGLLVVGMADDGVVMGCLSLSQDRLNDLERAGSVYCPDARFKCKRVSVVRPDLAEDFVLVFRVHYRHDKVVETVSNEAFTRLGETKKKLTREEVRELQIDKGQVDLELEPVELKYPEDFDLDLVRQFANGVRTIRELSGDITDEEVLDLRHLGKREFSGFKPNNACALLFASDPMTRFPGCKIRFLRFDGEQEFSGERFNAVKDQSVEGSIPRQILEIEKILDSNIRDFSRLGDDGKFYTAPEYPKLAWYEAVVNACVHRSYGLRNMNIFVKMFDDRLVVESPGAFPPFVTSENIYEVHHPRNPYLMEAMFYLKFVKCAHEGTRRIRDTMIGMNLPQPEFEQKESGYASVRVTLRNRIKQRKVWIDSDASALLGEALSKTLSLHEKRVINFACEHGDISVSQVQRLTSRTWPSAKKVLDLLEQKGILYHNKRQGLERDPQARYVLKVHKEE